MTHFLPIFIVQKLLHVQAIFIVLYKDNDNLLAEFYILRNAQNKICGQKTIVVWVLGKKARAMYDIHLIL